MPIYVCLYSINRYPSTEAKLPSPRSLSQHTHNAQSSILLPEWFICPSVYLFLLGSFSSSTISFSLTVFVPHIVVISYLSYGTLSFLVNIQLHCHSTVPLPSRHLPPFSQIPLTITRSPVASISRMSQEYALSAAGCSGAPPALSHVSRIGCL
jgi:hypothetical protein